MSNNNHGRARKRRKKRLKKSVKIFLFIFIIILLLLGYLGYAYYASLHAEDPHGKIGGAAPTLDDNKESNQSDDEDNTVTADYWILDAGNGEAVYIKIGQTEVLIDTGTKDTTEKTVKTVKDNISGELDYVVLTNGEENRIGGVEKLYKDVDVTHTIIGDLGNKESSIKKAIGKNGTVEKCKSSTYELEAEATIYIHKPDVSSNDPLDTSLMTVFQYGDTRFVTESDVGIKGEAKLLGFVSDCDVLVLAKHGSDQSNKVNLNERYSIASAAKGAALPSAAVIKAKSSVFSTGKSGTIKFISDSTMVETELGYEDTLKEKTE